MQKGFTLIELLVVVLIIGILAAVAVPQYEKAVEKARAAEAFLALKSLSDASSLYHLANGSYTGLSNDELDIQLALDTQNFTFTVGGGAIYTPQHMDLIAYRKNGTYHLVLVHTNGSKLRMYCRAASAVWVCNSLGAKNCAPNTECPLP